MLAERLIEAEKAVRSKDRAMDRAEQGEAEAGRKVEELEAEVRRTKAQLEAAEEEILEVQGQEVMGSG